MKTETNYIIPAALSAASNRSTGEDYTVSDYHGNENRDRRLHRVAGRLDACQHPVLDFVINLHDHKGILTATCFDPCDPDARKQIVQTIFKAWSDEHEYSGHVYFLPITFAGVSTWYSLGREEPLHIAHKAMEEGVVVYSNCGYVEYSPEARMRAAVSSSAYKAEVQALSKTFA